MTTYVLWAWDAPHRKWNEARAGSMQRMQELAASRQKDADELGIAGAKYLALPAGKRPDDSEIPDTLPLSTETTAALAGEPLTHFFHCWRFPEHHACAVALIERQAREYDELLVRADRAERELRRSA